MGEGEIGRGGGFVGTRVLLLPPLPFSPSPTLVRPRHANLDLVARDAHVERVDRQSRIVGPFAVADAEAPGVPRADTTPSSSR